MPGSLIEGDHFVFDHSRDTFADRLDSRVSRVIIDQPPALFHTVAIAVCQVVVSAGDERLLLDGLTPLFPGQKRHMRFFAEPQVHRFRKTLQGHGIR